MKLEVDSENKIQYRLYTKPTDARLYLRTDSFHPPHVFRSVAFSQMLRVANRNSQTSTRRTDLDQLKIDLQRSGHKKETLDRLEVDVLQHREEPRNRGDQVEEQADDSIVFAVPYFKELPELRSLVHEMMDDIQTLTGPIKITIAAKKGRSVGNAVLRNSAIGRTPVDSSADRTQACGAPRCMTCPHMCKSGDVFVINGKDLVVPGKHDCKTKNCIYMAQCTICNQMVGDSTTVVSEDSYIGQTMQKFHMRINGHRSSFNERDYKKYALSIHAFERHADGDFNSDNFSLNIYKFVVIKDCSPRLLNREEFRYIEGFRTNALGLNRCKVERG